MFAHLQRVSLSFMDKTEVGRLMSRLQGDVNSMQEFLETSVMSVGDISAAVRHRHRALLVSIPAGAAHYVDHAVLFLVRIVWLPRAKKAFMYAHETSSIANGALAEGINGVRTIQSLDRQRVNFDLYDEKARENCARTSSRPAMRRSWCPSSTRLPASPWRSSSSWGGQMVPLTGALDVGVMVAFLFYIQRFFDPIRSLTMQYSVMQRAMARASASPRCWTPIDVADRPGAAELPRDMDGSVEFRNVTSATARASRCWKNVSFRVNRARPWRWSARPARARLPRWRWSTASTTSGTAPCWSAATTCAT